MSRAITTHDLCDLTAYEASRNGMRRQAVALRKLRRVQLGDQVSLVFENRETLLFQIHELARAEGITDPDALEAECAVYSALLPTENELSAAMYVQVPDGNGLIEVLKSLAGLDEQMTLMVGDEPIRVTCEHGVSPEERMAAVQYVRFGLSDSQRAGFRDPSVTALLEIAHTSYQAQATIEGNCRRSMIEDLQ